MTDTFQTNIDNIRQNSPEWIGQKVKDELSSLNKEVDMFYEIKNQTVEYKMDVVKTYLESIQNLEWSQLRDKWSAWVMAVQIALESMKDEKWNSKYNVWKVDGFYWSNTKEAILKFQKDSGFEWEDVDGWAGTKTIKKIIEKIWGSVSNNTENNTQESSNQTNQSKKESKEKVDNTQKINHEQIVKWRDHKKYKAITKELKDLPKDYKRKNPEAKYNEQDTNTYQTVYHVYTWKSKKPYIFYSNGTCRSPLDDQIYDSKAIVEKLKNWRWSNESYEDVHFVMDNLRDTLKDFKVKLDWKEYSIWIAQYGKKLNLSLNNTHPSLIEQYAIWDFLDKEWRFSKDYVKKVISKQLEKKFTEQFKTEYVLKELRKIAYTKKYSFSDIFGNIDITAKHNKYLKELDGNRKKIVLDKQMSRNWLNINFELDDEWGNESYHKFSVKYTQFLDTNGKFSEDRLKWFLKEKITKIVNENF